jgi:hypothetical protein
MAGGMSQPAKNGPGLLARILLAFFLPWKILFDRAFAERVEQLAGGEPASALPAGPELLAHHPHAPEPETPEPEPEPALDPVPALRLLAVLQRDGRLVDFLQEDISGAGDADVGAAARVVHAGCRKALAEYVTLEPVRPEAEGDSLTLDAGFDPGKVRLTGNVVGEPPYRGRLAHPGWRAARVTLPPPLEGQDPLVIAPAEVEL